MRKVYWDENANPIGTHLANIIYELRSEDDGDDLILDAVCLADFEETAESVMYDALVTEYRLLERKMNVMRRVMNRVSADLKVREDNGPDDMGVIISKPFKRNGTSNVAALFQLTDGQTISIIFHNPDTTPNRVLPTDELISWKWMVNKKDVTIVVAPEKGQDLNVNEVARRIMRLAEKNSERFQAANAKRAERIANIENQKAEIGNLEQSLTGIKSDCEAAELQYNDALESLENLKKERDKAIQSSQVRAEERIMREANQHDTKEQNVDDLPPPVSEVTETEEAKPAVENPEEVNEEGSKEDITVNGERPVPMPNYPVRQVKLSELLKSGRLWDRGETLSRTYPKRDKLMKLSGFKLELSASRKNLHGMKGPDGNEINSRTAQDIWSRLNGAYWDNVKTEFSDPDLLRLLCLDVEDDITGTDKDVQAGSVGLWADLLFPDIHVPIPEGFVPVLDPLHAHLERKKAKAKRQKPSWSHILVESETEKAYKVNYAVPEGHFDGNEQSFSRRAYIPKAQSVVDGNQLVAVEKWIAEKYGFPYSIEPVTVVPREDAENQESLDVEDGRHDLTKEQESALFDLLYDNDLIGESGKYAVEENGKEPRVVKSELLEFTEGRKELKLQSVIKNVTMTSLIKWRPNAGLALNVSTTVWGVSIDRTVVDDEVKSKIVSYMGVDLPAPDESNDADPKNIKLSQIIKLGRLWEKGGKVRTYFNNEIDDVLERIGFKVERSAKGKVMSVTDPDGDSMSNNKYSGLRMSLYGSYFDHVSRTFKTKFGTVDMNEKFEQWGITFEDDLPKRDENGDLVDVAEEAKESATESTVIDVQWESDNAYLQTLINGTADMADRKTHSTKLREIYGRVKDDAEKMSVLKQAMKAWEAYALGKASVFKG